MLKCLIVLMAIIAISVDAWCFKGWEKTGYKGKYSSHHSSSGDKGCYNMISPVAGHLNSFKYWGSYCTVTLFSGPNCTGKNLGHSMGSWRKSSLTAAGTKAKSIGITGTLCHLDVAPCNLTP